VGKTNLNKNQNAKLLTIGVIYRHPRGSYACFQEQISKFLHKFSHFNKPFVLTNTLYSAGSYSLINRPTRIAPTSATALDHIYCNSLQKISERGILISDLSDHLGTFCIVTSNISKSYSNCFKIRDMKKFNVETYCEDVINKLKSFSNQENPNNIIRSILTAITEATNLHAPLRNFSPKEKKIETKT